MQAKQSFEYIDYHTSYFATTLKTAGDFVRIFNKFLALNGWTEEEYLLTKKQRTN